MAVALDTGKGATLLVIADDSHCSAYDALFRGSGIDLHYISEVSHSQARPLNPTEVRRYLEEHPGESDGILICGCCADSLRIVKEHFPGRVIGTDYGHASSGFPGVDFEGNVDLYPVGMEPQPFISDARKLLGLS